MARRARRAVVALRIEALEPRTLLSGNTADELFVRFKPSLPAATIQAALATVGASVVERYPSGPMLVSLRPGVDSGRALQRLQLSPLVVYAEPNVAIRSEAVAPNDPYFNQLWGLNNANNVDIDAPEAWDLAQGRNTTIIAVLDTGIDLGNADLKSRLWVDPTYGTSGSRIIQRRARLPRLNQRDFGPGADGDPGAGDAWNAITAKRLGDDPDHAAEGVPAARRRLQPIRLNRRNAARLNLSRGAVHGWNFVSNTSNVQDNNGHGTHVAGTLAAGGNNATGVTGVDWYSTIMPVKVLDQHGNGTVEAAINGIYYAVNHGARVINASWGGGNYSQALRDAIAYAGSRGVVFVTAAGNDGRNNDLAPSYPGSYRLDNQITVAAVDALGQLAGFSDYGANTVDLVAPGVNILSTVPGGLASYSGTSMATPFVSGVVALVLSLHPELSAQQAVQRVLSTTKPIGGAAGRTITGGIVDAYNAVNFGNYSASTATV